jgi:hypothetical protein
MRTIFYRRNIGTLVLRLLGMGEFRRLPTFLMLLNFNLFRDSNTRTQWSSDIAPPLLSAQERLWVDVPYYALLHFTTTNCGVQTLTQLRILTLLLSSWICFFKTTRILPMFIAYQNTGSKACTDQYFFWHQSFLWPTNAHFINIKMLKLTIKTFV